MSQAAAHRELAVDVVVRKLARTAPLHLVASGEEVSNAVIDMMIDRPMGLQPSAVAYADKSRGSAFSRSRIWARPLCCLVSRPLRS